MRGEGEGRGQWRGRGALLERGRRYHRGSEDDFRREGKASRETALGRRGSSQ